VRQTISFNTNKQNPNVPVTEASSVPIRQPCVSSLRKTSIKGQSSFAACRLKKESGAAT